MMHLLLLLAALTSPLDANKAVARRIFDEILTRGHFELASQLYAPDFVNHGMTRNATLAEDQAAAQGWLKAFPDLTIQAEVVAAEGDLVAVVWHARGTNSGSGNGLPATGRRTDGRGMTIWRVVDGKVTEEWSEFSTNELLRQLGLKSEAPPDARAIAVAHVAGERKITKTITDGDLVAMLYTVDGRRGMSMLRVRDGRVAEEWSFVAD